MSVRRPPDGYAGVVGRWGTVVWKEASSWLDDALARHDSLHDWAAAQPEVDTHRGRGTVFTVPAPMTGPDGSARWAVRHYRRGGAMERSLVDRYVRVGRSRPLRETRASVAARARGIPTPAVIAGVSYTDGAFYRCDLVTEFVDGGRPLSEVLHRTDGSKEWSDAMRAAGTLIQQLAEAGIYHIDLNAHNIVLPPEEGAEAWAIDLDRARVLRGPSGTIADRMTARLTRSIVKVGTPTGEPIGFREVMAALAPPTRRP